MYSDQGRPDGTIRAERNYGVDALRMVSMFMVVQLHILLAGGVLDRAQGLSLLAGGLTGQYMTVWFMEIAAYCAVNCYGLISGYVGVTARYRFANYAVLWLRVAFYTVTICALFTIFLPGSASAAMWIKAFFPVTSQTYWYFTAYTGLFLFMPLLNTAIRSLGKKRLAVFLVVSAVLLSCIPTLCYKDIFGLNFGYSAWWLMILYVAGGYIRLYGLFPRIGPVWMLLGYLASVCLTWVYKVVCANGLLQGGIDLISYTSPTIVVAGVFLFLAFERANIHKAARRVIAFLSPLAFSVYIIHADPLIWDRWIANGFSAFAAYPTVGAAAAVLAAAAAIYIICSAIDLLREKLFAALRIKQRLTALEKRLLKE